MPSDFPFELLTDPKILSGFGSWEEEVYRDFLAFQQGTLSEDDLTAKYVKTVAILALDMSGLTESAMEGGDLASMLKIFDIQKVCSPVFMENRAIDIHTYADDFISTFETAGQALDSAFEIHHRIQAFNESTLATGKGISCCIGLGYGPVYRIGQNKASGDEMNRTSKLGEDTARGFETLLTEQCYLQVKHRQDAVFEERSHESLSFPFYTAVYTGEK